MNDDDFVREFEVCTLAEDQFHHRDHVRLGWLYLDRFTATEALARFSSGLQRFAAAKGRDGLYHATITWAFLLLIQERRAQAPAGEPWNEFAERNPDLLRWNPSVLERYYRAETLASPRARAGFVLPDRLETAPA